MKAPTVRAEGRDIPFDPQKLSLEADPLSKWGVRLQNSSTQSPKKGGPLLESINQRGGPPLDFINQKGVRLQISSTRRGSASRIHQHTAPKRGSASRIHQPTAPNQPKMGVSLQGQFIWIQRYNIVDMRLFQSICEVGQFQRHLIGQNLFHQPTGFKRGFHLSTSSTF